MVACVPIVSFELAGFVHPCSVMLGPNMFQHRDLRAWSNGSFNPMSCRRFCEEVGNSMCSLSNAAFQLIGFWVQLWKWYVLQVQLFEPFESVF